MNNNCPNPSFAEGNDTSMQRGWECPKCGAVMSPRVGVCVNCRGRDYNTSALGDTSYIEGIDWVKKQTSTGASYIVSVDVMNGNYKVGGKRK